MFLQDMQKRLSIQVKQTKSHGGDPSHSIKMFDFMRDLAPFRPSAFSKDAV
jgi:hypothetical protein